MSQPANGTRTSKDEELIPAHAELAGVIAALVCLVGTAVEVLLHLDSLSDPNTRRLWVLIWGGGAGVGLVMGMAGLLLLPTSVPKDASLQQLAKLRGRIAVVGAALVLVVAPIVSGVSGLDVRLGLILLAAGFMIGIVPAYLIDTRRVRNRLHRERR